ncbi:hypothetical protein [Amycolatopsis sp. MtRt-6]|uniref:hypothetical protein n=1 Tax=Amycolatopsis sp. MtRt-6 TaxID=2792782 RepID=UPI001A90B940|nr:hypothetical protein [Amycolatopsis sp. MtRt-6]
MRWQSEGWLTVRDGDRPSAGIVRLTLDPEEVVGGQALQLQLGAIGQDADAAERAGRALVRIQGLLGPDAVSTPLLDGGRGPGERVRLIPWGEPRRPVLEDRPWPGRLPVPSPALVPADPVSAAGQGVAGSNPVSPTDTLAGPVTSTPPLTGPLCCLDPFRSHKAIPWLLSASPLDPESPPRTLPHFATFSGCPLLTE